MSHLEVGRNRLHQIKWADTYDYKLQDMHVELVKDFLARIAQWADALECNSDWPFLDVANTIDQKRTFSINTCVLDLLPTDGLIRRACDCYLHWVELMDYDHYAEFEQLPEPYEPLIVAFESGLNSIRRESGMLMIGTVGIRISGGPPSFLD